MARPKKIQWPIEFDEMLRYAMPNKRLEDRFRFYRSYFLRDYIHLQSTLKASGEEIELRLKQDREKRFSENDAHHIRLWIGMNMDAWKREIRRERARKMANGKWKRFYEKRAQNPH
jgi:hypothetical protein